MAREKKQAAAAPRLDWSMVPGTKSEQISLAKRTNKPIAIKHGGRGQWDVSVFGIYIGNVPTKEAARHAAHMIGRYKLDLGDFVYAYTEGY